MSAILPIETHLIDDPRNASMICAAAVNLVDLVNRCLGDMACSYHESNLIPNYLSSVVLVLDSPSLSSCEQLRGLSAPDPKLVLLPKRMEIAGKPYRDINCSICYLHLASLVGPMAPRRSLSGCDKRQ